MATDEHLDELFPDVTENFETGDTLHSNSRLPDTAPDSAADDLMDDEISFDTVRDGEISSADEIEHPVYISYPMPRSSRKPYTSPTQALSRPARGSKATAVPATSSEPVPMGQELPHPARRKHARTLVTSAAAVVLAAGATIAYAGLGSSTDDDGAVPPSLSSSNSTVPAGFFAAEPVWCEATATADTVVGNGPGDPTTGPGLILAFDHAYYTEHDGAKVAAMMLNPNPIGPIQDSINSAAESNTEHCLTIVTTEIPDVFDVQLALRTDSGSEGTVHQRIGVAPSANGLKIATLEEIPR